MNKNVCLHCLCPMRICMNGKLNCCVNSQIWMFRWCRYPLEAFSPEHLWHSIGDSMLWQQKRRNFWKQNSHTTLAKWIKLAFALAYFNLVLCYFSYSVIAKPFPVVCSVILIDMSRFSLSFETGKKKPFNSTSTYAVVALIFTDTSQFRLNDFGVKWVATQMMVTWNCR